VNKAGGAVGYSAAFFYFDVTDIVVLLTAAVSAATYLKVGHSGNTSTISNRELTMSLANFDSITKLFRDSGEKAKHRQELFQEVLLMVLSRATRADSNVELVEITKVREVLKAQLDMDFSEAEIRTAASSAIFETQSLERYLSSATRKLDERERTIILQSLAKVIRSDDEIRVFELDFFDKVALALRASPSEIAGLVGV